MRSMRANWGRNVVALALLSAALLCTGQLGAVRADDASQRADIVAAIDRELTEIASVLGDVPRASSEAPVARALDVLDDVAEDVGTLRVHKGRRSRCKSHR